MGKMFRIEKSKYGKGKVIVVTGASAGVGRAVVRRFARERAVIGLMARGQEGLDAAQREVEHAGGKALALPTDVSDPIQVEQAAAEVEAAFGPIDVWINNAMVSVFSPFQEMTPEEFRRVTEVTYLGYVYGTMAALRRMLPRDRGVIVQVGSALAYRGIPLQSAYCGAKHAIQGFTESVRTELLHDRSQVWITLVHLPAVNTPQFNWVKTRLPRKPQPVPPIYQPEVAAEAVYFAAHQRRREVWVSASTIKTILGNRIVPGYVDRVLAKQGFESQQYDGLVDPGRQNNLWEPVLVDYGAHGDFDSRAKNHSLQLWVDMHRGMVALLLAGLIGAAFTFVSGSRLLSGK